MQHRHARGGTLVLGGGFAGGYVARLLGRARRHDRQPRELHALHADRCPEAASGHPRAAPRRRPAPDDVPARRPRPRRDRPASTRSRGTSPSRPRRAASSSSTRTSSSRSAPSRAPSRSRASPSTRWVSRISPTRSPSATTSSASSRRRTRSSTRTSPGATSTFVFVGAGYAGVEALAELADLVRDALRYYPRLREVEQRWVLVDAAPKILPEIPTRLGDYAARELAKRGVDIRVDDDPRFRRGAGARRSRTASASRRTRSSGPPGCGRRPSVGEFGLPLDERGG